MPCMAFGVRYGGPRQRPLLGSSAMRNPPSSPCKPGLSPLPRRSGIARKFQLSSAAKLSGDGDQLSLAPPAMLDLLSECVGRAFFSGAAGRVRYRAVKLENVKTGLRW